MTARRQHQNQQAEADFPFAARDHGQSAQANDDPGRPAIQNAGEMRVHRAPGRSGKQICRRDNKMGARPGRVHNDPPCSRSKGPGRSRRTCPS
jgi:hypothetical protein